MVKIEPGDKNVQITFRLSKKIWSSDSSEKSKPN